MKPLLSCVRSFFRIFQLRGYISKTKNSYVLWLEELLEHKGKKPQTQQFMSNGGPVLLGFSSV